VCPVWWCCSLAADACSVSYQYRRGMYRPCRRNRRRIARIFGEDELGLPGTPARIRHADAQPAHLRQVMSASTAGSAIDSIYSVGVACCMGFKGGATRRARLRGCALRGAVAGDAPGGPLALAPGVGVGAVTAPRCSVTATATGVCVCVCVCIEYRAQIMRCGCTSNIHVARDGRRCRHKDLDLGPRTKLLQWAYLRLLPAPPRALASPSWFPGALKMQAAISEYPGSE
jgi:hypothetical protein